MAPAPVRVNRPRQIHVRAGDVRHDACVIHGRDFPPVGAIVKRAARRAGRLAPRTLERPDGRIERRIDGRPNASRYAGGIGGVSRSSSAVQPPEQVGRQWRRRLPAAGRSLC
ncbi:hypothetical protein NX868_20200 [Burkholderia thailandensis]|uniref:hypothetical protein n=1 Tax=Burkholderia thailandensis TaxID=57975 RepID=UPI00016A69CE|nr:hypothetical protein [Burkholderia thailandensis]AJT48635.1 hypothetical protein DR62_05920 [Burkholderia thailandensis]AOI50860.1 hypothetical protein WI24_02970 [Burkholderia thailandensis]AOJ49898.1 hypothetical protein AQ475_02990 [Burkholderia thailandensis]AVR25287.1 hypothetical protein A8H32_09380 [Burkholderia thailandensis]MCS3389978.1 hypothetical protein [Burkholderia thailandensis]